MLHCAFKRELYYWQTTDIDAKSSSTVKLYLSFRKKPVYLYLLVHNSNMWFVFCSSNKAFSFDINLLSGFEDLFTNMENLQCLCLYGVEEHVIVARTAGII